MFAEVTLGSATETALLDEVGILSTLLSCLGIFVSLGQVLKPLLRGIVVPRVDEVNLISADLLSWQLLGRELVQEVILVLLAKVVEAVFEIRLNDLDSDLSLLSLILQTLLLLTHAVVGEGPETDLTQKWLNVFLDCLEEISVIEVKDFFY